ncbi:MAG: hypothetical protein ACTS6H_00370 [Candidatus Hodgkinia cicadicola]
MFKELVLVKIDKIASVENYKHDGDGFDGFNETVTNFLFRESRNKVRKFMSKWHLISYVDSLRLISRPHVR